MYIKIMIEIQKLLFIYDFFFIRGYLRLLNKTIQYLIKKLYFNFCKWNIHKGTEKTFVKYNIMYNLI